MRARGFTLTELVLILVLISIVAVVALPRLNIEGFERQTFARELTVALRHAQRLAMASGCHVTVAVDAQGYSASWTGAPDCQAGPVSHPARGGNLSAEGPVVGGGSVVFDSQGRTESGLVVVLEDGREIRVEAGSGHVHG